MSSPEAHRLILAEGQGVMGAATKQYKGFVRYFNVCNHENIIFFIENNNNIIP